MHAVQEDVAVRADSICVHGDSDGAIRMAEATRALFEAEGIVVAPFVGSAA